MNFGKNIKSLREEFALTQAEFGKILGVSDRAVSSWENNIKIPRMGTIQKIADFFNIPKSLLIDSNDILLEKDVVKYMKQAFLSPELVNFEVIGSVKAGYDGRAVEEYTGEFVAIPKSMLSNIPPNEFFVLKVKGNSMYPKIIEGDIVLVRRTPTVDSESIAVIIYNGNESTVKKLRYTPGQDWFEMIPINPEYQTKRIENEDLKECRVLGKVVKLIRDL